MKNLKSSSYVEILIKKGNLRLLVSVYGSTSRARLYNTKNTNSKNVKISEKYLDTLLNRAKHEGIEISEEIIAKEKYTIIKSVWKI